MSKRDLADAIRDVTECTNAQAGAAVDAVVELITKTLKKEGKYSLLGFGSFSVRKRAARTGRNPRTGETIKIKAGKVVRFKAATALKDKV